MPEAPTTRTAAFSEEELFTPTLTEEDDAVGFECPWRPWSLVILSFFFGFPAGGALLALNFARLGVPRKVLPAVFAVIALTLLIAALSGWSRVHLPDSGQLIVERLLDTGGAGLLAWAQRRRYRVFQGSNGEAGKLLLPGALAAALSLAVQFALNLLFVSLFQR